MTDDEIIALAKRLGWNVEHAQTNRMLILFTREVVAVEREACAKVCEGINDGTPYNQAIECADAIRARGQA